MSGRKKETEEVDIYIYIVFMEHALEEILFYMPHPPHNPFSAPYMIAPLRNIRQEALC